MGIGYRLILLAEDREMKKIVRAFPIDLRII